LGKGALTIPTIEGEMDGEKIDFENIEYSTELALDDDGYLSIDGRIGVEKGEVKQIKLGKTGYEVRIDGLPVDAVDELYATYFKLLGSDYSNPDALQSTIMTMLNGSFPKLFDGPVNLTLAFDVDFEGPEGALAGRTALNVGGTDGLITAILDQTVEKADLPEVSLTDSAARITLSDLDGGVLSEIYNDFIQILMMDLPEWQQTEEIELITVEKFPRMITSDTRLTLDNLALNMPDGTASASGDVGFTGTGPLDLENPLMLIPRAEANLSARIEEGALIWILAREQIEELRQSFADAGRPVSEDLIRKLAADSARGQISAFEAQSFIKRDGDSLTLDAEFRDGMLILNGIERPDLMGQ
ncbi:MAG: DUF945 family protein, partial [Proteobacteria bacterium]|nr:DUF945 family protein [Pseudomonadota bacterium]